MKIQSKTQFWTQPKDEIIQKIDHIFTFLSIPTYINIIINVFYFNPWLLALNGTTALVIFMIQQSIKKYNNEEKQYEQ